MSSALGQSKTASCIKDQICRPDLKITWSTCGMPVHLKDQFSVGTKAQTRLVGVPASVSKVAASINLTLPLSLTPGNIGNDGLMVVEYVDTDAGMNEAVDSYASLLIDSSSTTLTKLPTVCPLSFIVAWDVLFH